jgi:hypothetical protein
LSAEIRPQPFSSLPPERGFKSATGGAWRLARREEREVRAEFGETWGRYAMVTPAFCRGRRIAARHV